MEMGIEKYNFRLIDIKMWQLESDELDISWHRFNCLASHYRYDRQDGPHRTIFYLASGGKIEYSYTAKLEILHLVVR